MEGESDCSVVELRSAARAARDLEAASLWINAVNEPCTIQTDEFVGHSVDMAKEKISSDLSWMDCRSGLEDYGSFSNYRHFSLLHGSVKRSDGDHAVTVGKYGHVGSGELRFPEDASDARPERRTKNVTRNKEDTGTYRKDFTSKGYDCKCASSCKTQTNSLKECFVPCLNSINELEKRFGSKYELHFDVVAKGRPKSDVYRYKRKLQVELGEWETELNEKSQNEPYIAVENKVDNVRPPHEFEYIRSSIIPPSVNHLFDRNYLVGCSCVRCTPRHCECPHNHGGEFAYDHFGRILFEPGKPVYECNSQCACSVTCRNRVVQRGRTVKVAIFRTANGRGWGVKTMEPIQKKQFVTEYVGELIMNEEAEKRGKRYDAEGQTYLFDLDYNDGDCQYTLDAKKYGNISHFINHSCDPNLNVYGIWCDTLDPALPRIALFACRNIAAGEELTFDYLMTADENSAPPRKAKRMKCGCGSKNCRKYLY